MNVYVDYLSFFWFTTMGLELEEIIKAIAPFEWLWLPCESLQLGLLVQVTLPSIIKVLTSLIKAQSHPCSQRGPILVHLCHHLKGSIALLDAILFYNESTIQLHYFCCHMSNSFKGWISLYILSFHNESNNLINESNTTIFLV